MASVLTLDTMRVVSSPVARIPDQRQIANKFLYSESSSSTSMRMLQEITVLLLRLIYLWRMNRRAQNRH